MVIEGQTSTLEMSGATTLSKGAATNILALTLTIDRGPDVNVRDGHKDISATKLAIEGRCDEDSLWTLPSKVQRFNSYKQEQSP